PGRTSAPSASISRAPRPSTAPTATTRSPSMATSAVRAGAPVPSRTVPPLMTSSWAGTSGGGGQHRRVDAVQLGDVVAEYGPGLLVGHAGGVLVEQLLGPRPRRVAVGEVVGPHQPLPVHRVGEAEGGPVILERDVDVVGEVLARQALQVGAGLEPVAVPVEGVVHAV